MRDTTPVAMRVSILQHDFVQGDKELLVAVQRQREDAPPLSLEIRPGQTKMWSTRNPNDL
jgi:hypothetical protein